MHSSKKTATPLYEGDVANVEAEASTRRSLNLHRRCRVLQSAAAGRCKNAANDDEYRHTAGYRDAVIAITDVSQAVWA